MPPLSCLCAGLRRAARAVTRLYDEELRDTGLSGPQFTLLQALQLAGPLTQGQLGQALAIDSTTLSRSLKPLQAARLIRIDPGRDRRERHLCLTREGRVRLDRASPAWERAQRRLKAKVGSDRWTALVAELSRVAGEATRA